jgi:hypothetical protein
MASTTASHPCGEMDDRTSATLKLARSSMELEFDSLIPNYFDGGGG